MVDRVFPDPLVEFEDLPHCEFYGAGLAAVGHSESLLAAAIVLAYFARGLPQGLLLPEPLLLDLVAETEVLHKPGNFFQFLPAYFGHLLH